MSCENEGFNISSNLWNIKGTVNYKKCTICEIKKILLSHSSLTLYMIFEIFDVYGKIVE